MFDSEFFGYSRRAKRTAWTPSIALFLEACSNGVGRRLDITRTRTPARLGSTRGCSLNTYLLANLWQPTAAFIDELTDKLSGRRVSRSALGNDKDFLTTRVAYKLNLRGPCVTVQSACATSLVAICQASQALLNFQCDMTLAGGVSITFPQHRGHVSSGWRHQPRAMAYCRPFDARGFGHCLSAMALASCVLKRMEDAVRDGDHIAAVIRGFAVNNDGAAQG